MKRILAIVFLFVNSLYAQDSVPTNLTKWNLQFGGSYTDGNVRLMGVIGNANLSYSKKRTELTLAPQFAFTQVQQEDKFVIKQREFFVSMTAQEKIRTGKWFSSGEAESSYMKRIRLRTSIGSGWSFDIKKSDRIRFAISEALLFESYLSDVSLNKNLQSVRLSTRVRLQMDKPLSVDGTLFIQPAVWSDIGVPNLQNINGRLQLTATVPITKRLQIGVTATAIQSGVSHWIDPAISPLDWTTGIILQIKN